MKETKDGWRKPRGICRSFFGSGVLTVVVIAVVSGGCLGMPSVRDADVRGERTAICARCRMHHSKCIRNDEPPGGLKM